MLGYSTRGSMNWILQNKKSTRLKRSHQHHLCKAYASPVSLCFAVLHLWWHQQLPPGVGPYVEWLFSPTQTDGRLLALAKWLRNLCIPALFMTWKVKLLSLLIICLWVACKSKGNNINGTNMLNFNSTWFHNLTIIISLLLAGCFFIYLFF